MIFSFHLVVLSIMTSNIAGHWTPRFLTKFFKRYILVSKVNWLYMLSVVRKNLLYKLSLAMIRVSINVHPRRVPVITSNSFTRYKVTHNIGNFSIKKDTCSLTSTFLYLHSQSNKSIYLENATRFSLALIIWWW